MSIIDTNSYIRIINSKALVTSIIILFTLCYNNLYADELHLVVNGLSHHTTSAPNKKYNERNYGLGLQYDFNKFDKNILPFINLGSLTDSNNNPSYYIGTGITHRTIFRNYHTNFHFDAGLTMFLISREYSSNSGTGTTEVFPGALPMISFGTEYTSLNVTYIPEMSFTKTSVWFFQLKYKL